jgi:biotin carboxyl carrier protein
MNCIEPIITHIPDGLQVSSPVVGLFHCCLLNRQPLAPGMKIGTLKILNTTYPLLLPHSIFGNAVIDANKDHVIAVEYGQTLFSIIRLAEDITQPGQGNQKNSIQEITSGNTINAFTMGIFYRKPSPDTPDYVKEGQQISKGTVLGLIEVMKTFNQVVFHGSENSDTAKIKKILVSDSQEVKQGEALFIIEEI